MHIKCAIASGTALAFLVTRAPDQARKRIAEITGQPARVVWIDLPESGVSSADHLERCAAEFGATVKLTTGHLGSVWLTHVASADAIDGDQVREIARAERDAMRAEARRTVEIRRLHHRLAELGANDDKVAVRAA